ncbi:MAG: hypothetical protein ACI4F4_04655 [Lachnospiraceae bacterium]
MKNNFEELNDIIAQFAENGYVNYKDIPFNDQQRIGNILYDLSQCVCRKENELLKTLTSYELGDVRQLFCYRVLDKYTSIVSYYIRCSAVGHKVTTGELVNYLKTNLRFAERDMIQKYEDTRKNNNQLNIPNKETQKRVDGSKKKYIYPLSSNTTITYKNGTESKSTIEDNVSYSSFNASDMTLSHIHINEYVSLFEYHPLQLFSFLKLTCQYNIPSLFELMDYTETEDMDAASIFDCFKTLLAIFERTYNVNMSRFYDYNVDDFIIKKGTNIKKKLATTDSIVRSKLKNYGREQDYFIVIEGKNKRKLYGYEMKL